MDRWGNHFKINYFCQFSAGQLPAGLIATAAELGHSLPMIVRLILVLNYQCYALDMQFNVDIKLRGKFINHSGDDTSRLFIQEIRGKPEYPSPTRFLISCL